MTAKAERARLQRIARELQRVVNELQNAVDIPIQPVISDEERDRRTAAGLCLACENPAVSRGLCNTCRREVGGQVAAGKWTDAELVAQNMILESKRAGRRRSGRVESLLDEARKRTAGQSVQEALTKAKKTRMKRKA